MTRQGGDRICACLNTAMLPISVRGLGYCSFSPFKKQKLQREVFVWFFFSWRHTAEEKNSREFVLLLPEGQRQGGLAASRAAQWRTGGKRPWLSEFSKPWANRSVHQANWELCLLKIRIKASGTSLGAHFSQGRVKVGQGCFSPTQVSSASSSYRAQETEIFHMEKHVLAATGQSKLSKQTEPSWFHHDLHCVQSLIVCCDFSY